MMYQAASDPSKISVLLSLRKRNDKLPVPEVACGSGSWCRKERGRNDGIGRKWLAISLGIVIFLMTINFRVVIAAHPPDASCTPPQRYVHTSLPEVDY
jgi:hypothetical protein